MQQPAQINDLREMSARVGRNMLLVQGAGGNSSAKGWRYAVGEGLRHMAVRCQDKDIFVPVALSAALAALRARRRTRAARAGRHDDIARLDRDLGCMR